MSILLETYQRCVTSQEVRKQGNGYNGPCPFCGGSDRLSDRFIVWPDKGFGPKESVGETCRKHGIAGVWFCRQCKRTGDSIAFLMEAEGMTFTSACAELGITPSAKKAPPRRTPQPPRSVEQSYTPKEWHIKADDPVKWREYAEKLHTESRESLHKNQHTLKWLADRGIGLQAVERYQIGYLQGQQGKTGRVRPRSALGLAPGKKKDGSPKKYVFIPRGIVIPHFDAAGRILRLRIRRPKPDVEQFGEKYMVLEGSSSQPMLLESAAPAQLAAYVTVEAELDAMLIHSITKERVGAFAALTNTGKPDATQHLILQVAAVNLIALDYDPREVTRPDGSVATETPGGMGWLWWRDTYANAKRWPVSIKKDPGEAFEAGVDLVEWLQLGLPPSISLSGPMEPFTPVLSDAGGGGEVEAASTSMPASSQKVLMLPNYLSAADIPAEVLALYELWRQVPSFAVHKRKDGGFSFRWNRAWEKESKENFERVSRLHTAIADGEWPREWIFRVNQNLSVNLKNFFHIYK